MDHNGEHRFSCWIDGYIDTQFDRLINLWQYKIRANQLDPPTYSFRGYQPTGITSRRYPFYLPHQILAKNDTASKTYSSLT